MSSSGIPLPEAPRILLIRLGAMGDVIHALPAAAALKHALPEAEISWAVEPRWAPLLEGHPALEHIVEIPLKAWRKRPFSGETLAGLRALRDDLRARRFDASIDFQGLLKSAILGRVAKPAVAVGFERRDLREPLAAWLYTHRFAANRRHVVDRNLALAHAVAGRGGSNPAEVFLPPGERSPELPDGDFVLASPLAGWKAKQWPPERYAELAAVAWRNRRLPLVLDGAPADAAYLRRIAEQAPEGSCVVHVSSLTQLIGATRAARLVLGADSGPLHLAAALGKAGVALYGPTDPDRNGPYGSTFKTLRRPGATTTYKRRKRFSDSMTAITANEVWAELAGLLDTQPKPREAFSGGAPLS
jgi:heptosyltransferase-1